MTSRDRSADEGRPPGPVHMRDGFGPVGKKYRAYCSCGYATTPRASQERAAALNAEHKLSLPVCALCGRDRWAADGLAGRWADLEILTVDGRPAEQVLVCRTDRRTCHDQKLMYTDRAAFEALGLELPPPHLRAIDGGGGGL